PAALRKTVGLARRRFLGGIVLPLLFAGHFYLGSGFCAMLAGGDRGFVGVGCGRRSTFSRRWLQQSRACKTSDSGACFRQIARIRSFIVMKKFLLFIILLAVATGAALLYLREQEFVVRLSEADLQEEIDEAFPV